MFVIQVTPSLFPAQLRRKTVRHPFSILISLNNLDISNIRTVYCQDFLILVYRGHQSGGMGKETGAGKQSFSYL
jgi:hypothetical protein